MLNVGAVIDRPQATNGPGQPLLRAKSRLSAVKLSHTRLRASVLPFGQFTFWSPLQHQIEKAPSLSKAWSFPVLCFFYQIFHGFEVTVEAVAGDGLTAGGTDVAHLTEVLPLRHIGDMHLHHGEAHSLGGI